MGSFEIVKQIQCKILNEPCQPQDGNSHIRDFGAHFFKFIVPTEFGSAQKFGQNERKIKAINKRLHYKSDATFFFFFD